MLGAVSVWARVRGPARGPAPGSKPRGAAGRAGPHRCRTSAIGRCGAGRAAARSRAMRDARLRVRPAFPWRLFQSLGSARRAGGGAPSAPPARDGPHRSAPFPASSLASALALAGRSEFSPGNGGRRALASRRAPGRRNVKPVRRRRSIRPSLQATPPIPGAGGGAAQPPGGQRAPICFSRTPLRLRVARRKWCTKF